MQDLAPGNRQQRRGRGRPRKTPATPDSLAVRRQQQPPRVSLSIPPSPDTATGAPFSAVDEGDDQPPPADHAPADRDGGGAPTISASEKAFTGYKGKHGAIKTGIVSTYGMAGMIVSRFDQVDGFLIMSKSETIADAWIAYGQADPRVMRVLKILFGHPALVVLMAHADLATGILSHHGQSPLGLLGGIKLPGMNANPNNSPASAPADSVASVSPQEPAPLPYAPAGAHAPTEAKGPPPAPPGNGELRVWPDQELPAEMEVAIRQAARQTGRPYKELRDEVMVQLAQAQMAQNGTVRAPGSLGMPVMVEG